MAYFNKQKYATDDAMRIGRLHTHLPGWTEANVAFMQVQRARARQLLLLPPAHAGAGQG